MTARCDYCQRNDIPLHELAFVKGENNDWKLCCRDCSQEQDITWHNPGELSWLEPYAGKYNFETEQLLNKIKISQGLRPDKTSSNERKFQRHNVSFKGIITRNNSDQEYPVYIMDLSKGGLKFITQDFFNLAEIANIRITNKSKSEFTDSFEIVRIIGKDDGTFEIGARFINSVTLNESENKRKTEKRHKLLLNLKYKSTSDNHTHEGAVIEIGKTSAILLVPEGFSKGSRLAIHVNSSRGVFAQQELSAIARVESCRTVYKHNHQLLVQLGKTRITKRNRVSSKLR